MSKRKFTREQAREALLKAGEEMIAEVGPSAGVARVSLAAVITRSGVPRPSAYRVFGEGEMDPQAAFHEALVMRVADVGSVFQVEAVTDELQPMIHAASEAGPEADPAELTTNLMQLVRMATGDSHTAIRDDSIFGVFLSALAATHGGAASEATIEALRVAEQELVEAIVDAARDALTAYGLRLKPGWTWRDLATTFLNAALGAELTANVSGGDPIHLPTGPGGEHEAWTKLGVSVLGLLATATEPDPRMVVSARPSQWLA